MKRIFIILTCISTFVALTGIYALGVLNFSINFKLHDVQDGSIGLNYVDSINAERSSGFLEIAWNTGDTGVFIIVDTPGVYICSVKDVWAIYDGTPFKHYSKALFIGGYPDTIVTDTLRFNIQGTETPYHRSDTVVMIRDGHLYTRTYCDSGWIEDDMYVYTESKPKHLGFWSGMLDTIIIEEVMRPVGIDAGTIIINGKKANINSWRGLLQP